MGNQKEEMRFTGTKEDCYHGVLHSSELNLLSLRIPKSACTYLCKGIFGDPMKVKYDQLSDAIDLVVNGELLEARKVPSFDITEPYEISDSLPFADNEYLSQYKDTPMIIFVRDPLERCCSALAMLVNLFLKQLDNVPLTYYADHMHDNDYKFARYPFIIETMIADNISKSNTIYDLANTIFGYRDYHGPHRENHLCPQTQWLNEIIKVKHNLVFFDVDDFTHDNVTHYISNHIQKPFVTDFTRANNAYDHPISMFTKSYLKAKICDVSSNSPLRQSALEIYKEDIELYNRLKPEFYRGAK